MKSLVAALSSLSLLLSMSAGMPVLASDVENGFEGTKLEIKVDGFDTADIDAAMLESKIRAHHPEADKIGVSVDDDGLEIKIEGFDASSIMFADKVDMLKHKFMGADRLEVRLDLADGTRFEFDSQDAEADVNVEDVDEDNSGEG